MKTPRNTRTASRSAREKVYKIANQSFADLKAHAGHEVNLTGEVKGDSVTVSKIEMPAKDKK